MRNQGRGTSAYAGTDSTGSPPLPDLTGVDLHLLREADDPAVRIAVDDVLRSPHRYTGTWWGEDGGDADYQPGHCVPAPRRTRRRTA